MVTGTVMFFHFMVHITMGFFFVVFFFMVYFVMVFHFSVSHHMHMVTGWAFHWHTSWSSGCFDNKIFQIFHITTHIHRSMVTHVHRSMVTHVHRSMVTHG